MSNQVQYRTASGAPRPVFKYVKPEDETLGSLYVCKDGRRLVDVSFRTLYDVQKTGATTITLYGQELPFTNCAEFDSAILFAADGTVLDQARFLKELVDKHELFLVAKEKRDPHGVKFQAAMFPKGTQFKCAGLSCGEGTIDRVYTATGNVFQNGARSWVVEHDTPSTLYDGFEGVNVSHVTEIVKGGVGVVNRRQNRERDRNVITMSKLREEDRYLREHYSECREFRRGFIYTYSSSEILHHILSKVDPALSIDGEKVHQFFGEEAGKRGFAHVAQLDENGYRMALGVKYKTCERFILKNINRFLQNLKEQDKQEQEDDRRYYEDSTHDD